MKGSDKKRLEQYNKEEMQSEIYKKLPKKCNIWLEQNLTPRKTSTILSLIEQMTETRAWKKGRGLTENSQWRLCKEQRETTLLPGCKMLASRDITCKT